jgi:hypothetical protein
MVRPLRKEDTCRVHSQYNTVDLWTQSFDFSIYDYVQRQRCSRPECFYSKEMFFSKNVRCKFLQRWHCNYSERSIGPAPIFSGSSERDVKSEIVIDGQCRIESLPDSSSRSPLKPPGGKHHSRCQFHKFFYFFGPKIFLQTMCGGPLLRPVRMTAPCSLGHEPRYWPNSSNGF